MPIRITGLASGLDTEAIISALVSSYNYKTVLRFTAFTQVWTDFVFQAGTI